MRIESGSFTAADLDVFNSDLLNHERLVLIERLERASERLAALGSRVPGAASDRPEGWNAKEILAHIMMLSRFYGVLTYRIGSGQMTELNLLENVRLRDVMSEQLLALPAAELVSEAQTQHRRTIEYLRSADASALERRCVIDGRWSFTAEEMARRPLVAHLELHLDQLDEALKS